MVKRIVILLGALIVCGAVFATIKTTSVQMPSEAIAINRVIPTTAASVKPSATPTEHVEAIPTPMPTTAKPVVKPVKKAKPIKHEMCPIKRTKPTKPKMIKPKAKASVKPDIEIPLPTEVIVPLPPDDSPAPTNDPSTIPSIPSTEPSLPEPSTPVVVEPSTEPLSPVTP